MAVSKRTRFEVLLRDNYTCRYCRTDGELTVDHVMPSALGGSDSPDNLVACCKDCNAGKTSTSPDSETVAAVTDDAVRWASAIKKAADILSEKSNEAESYLGAFLAAWPQYRYLPNGIEATVLRFHDLGLPESVMVDAAQWAGSGKGINNRAAYFAGICWKRLRAMQEIAEQIIASETSP